LFTFTNGNECLAAVSNIVMNLSTISLTSPT